MAKTVSRILLWNLWMIATVGICYMLYIYLPVDLRPMAYFFGAANVAASFITWATSLK